MNSQSNNYTFLSDSPLSADTDKDLAFGHKSIADSLIAIIQNSPKPFTIGLFGKWGTGKTTIIQSLRRQLNPSHFAIAHIDTWKYEGDSLRRQFLITLDEQFGLGLNYKDRLNQTLTEVDPNQDRIVFDWSLLKSTLTLIVVTLFIVGITVLFIPEYTVPFLGKAKPILSGLLISSSFILFAIEFVLKLLKKVEITITEHRTDSAEGFEFHFTKDVLGHKSIKNKTVLLVIDNLDRCSDEKAVEMLSTIKTFLIKETEKNKCVFLVACDDEAIKKHVAKLYALEQDIYDADEFLRKFFNTFIRIPRFIDTELQSYTETLLKETKVMELDSTEVAHVITSAFRLNPRQIKQFINVLLSHFLLAQQRENDEPFLMPKGTVTNHVSFLAKVLCIQIRFPIIYEQILSNYLTFEEAERIEGNKDYQNFIRSTKAIPIHDIRPFLYFKQSEHERAIPGYNELKIALEENNIEIILKKIELIKEKSEQVSSLERVLPAIIKQHRNRRTVLINIVSGSLEALHKLNLSLQGSYYNDVADLLADHGELREDLPQLEPQFVFKQILSRCIPSQRNFILKKYLALFTMKPNDEKSRLDQEFISRVFAQFLEYEDWIKDNIPLIRQAIVEQHFINIKLLKSLIGDEERLKKYFSEEGVGKFIEGLNDANVDNLDIFNAKSEIIKGFQTLLTPLVAKNLLQQYAFLLTNEQQKPIRVQRLTLVKEITEILRVYKKVILEGNHKAELASLSKGIIQGESGLSEWDQRKTYLPPLVVLSEMDEANKSALRSSIQGFFVSSDLKNILDALNHLSDDERTAAITQYYPQISHRVQREPEFMKGLHAVASPDVRTRWLVECISSDHHPNALAFIEEQGYKVDDDKPIVDALLNRAKRLNPPQKNKVYEVLNRLSWKKCDELKNIYATHIRELLMQSNVQLQAVGEEALNGAEVLNDSEKREIIRPTIEWLDTQNATNAFHQHAIKSILSNWASIKHQEGIKERFVEFIFYKLIIENNNIDSMKFGFEVLKEISPTLDKYNSHFADIQARVDREPNSQIKEVLESGLSNFGIAIKEILPPG